MVQCGVFAIAGANREPEDLFPKLQGKLARIGEVAAGVKITIHGPINIGNVDPDALMAGFMNYAESHKRVQAYSALEPTLELVLTPGDLSKLCREIPRRMVADLKVGSPGLVQTAHRHAQDLRDLGYTSVLITGEIPIRLDLSGLEQKKVNDPESEVTTWKLIVDLGTSGITARSADGDAAKGLGAYQLLRDSLHSIVRDIPNDRWANAVTLSLRSKESAFRDLGVDRVDLLDSSGDVITTWDWPE